MLNSCFQLIRRAQKAVPGILYSLLAISFLCSLLLRIRPVPDWSILKCTFVWDTLDQTIRQVGVNWSPTSSVWVCVNIISNAQSAPGLINMLA